MGLSGGELIDAIERQLQIEAGARDVASALAGRSSQESSEVGLPYYRSVAKRAIRALDASENWPAKSALCVVKVLSRALAKFLKLESVEASVREKVIAMYASAHARAYGKLVSAYRGKDAHLLALGKKNAFRGRYLREVLTLCAA